jgi:hypothetical protein
MISNESIVVRLPRSVFMHMFTDAELQRYTLDLFQIDLIKEEIGACNGFAVAIAHVPGLSELMRLSLPDCFCITTESFAFIAAAIKKHRDFEVSIVGTPCDAGPPRLKLAVNNTGHERRATSRICDLPLTIKEGKMPPLRQAFIGPTDRFVSVPINADVLRMLLDYADIIGHPIDKTIEFRVQLDGPQAIEFVIKQSLPNRSATGVVMPMSSGVHVVDPSKAEEPKVEAL